MYNLGGGLAAAYLADQHPPDIERYVDTIVGALHSELGSDKRLLLEPGRALVANSTVTLYTVQTVKRNVSTWVAVDGGMSDNLRPMMYGAQYEALIADRPHAQAQTRCHLTGKHCESGDVIVRDALLADPAVGDTVATPATGAYGYAMANNYNGVPRPPVVFVRDGSARVVVRRETYADLMSRDVPCMSDEPAKPFRVGLLGHGTVGAAFAELLPRHADRIARITGLRPELSGVLTRSRGGSFDDLLENSDLIVELMGGLEPARDYLLRAMRAGRHIVTANKQLLSHHGEELWEAARVAGRAAALRGGGRRRRAGHPRAPGVAGRRHDRSRARDRQRHHQLHPHRDGPDRGHVRRRAGRGAAARLRRGGPVRRRRRPRRGGQDGDHRPAGVRDAGPHRPGRATRGSSGSSPTTWSTPAT